MNHAQMTAQRPTQPAERLEQRWVPVTDERGHTRMEAHWFLAGQPAATHHAA